MKKKVYVTKSLYLPRRNKEYFLGQVERYNHGYDSADHPQYYRRIPKDVLRRMDELEKRRRELTEEYNTIKASFRKLVMEGFTSGTPVETAITELFDQKLHDKSRRLMMEGRKG